jgi:hypothetical protein
VKRSKPMRRRSARRIQRETPGDRLYVSWLHLRLCVGVAIYGHVCHGRIEQSHERKHTGLSLKAPPRRSVPMCSKLHQDWEQHRGPFEGWDRDRRVEFMDKHISRENAAFERGEDASDLAVPF